MSKTMLKCCYGISSKVNQFEHIFMLDYDHVDIKDVTEHLIGLQKEYGLSDFYLIKSTNGFNAICLDCLPISLIYNIGIRVDCPGDRNFFKYGFERSYYTMRMDKDKKLLAIIRNNNCFYDKSLQHKLFLEWFFDIKIEGNRFIDGDKLSIIQYPSNKNGYHLQDKEVLSIYDKR
jgi:hypothetical protein